MRIVAVADTHGSRAMMTHDHDVAGIIIDLPDDQLEALDAWCARAGIRVPS